jgi:hypothetical protein
MPDGKSFFYSALRDVKDPYSRETRFHMIGSDVAEGRDRRQDKRTQAKSQAQAHRPDGMWLIGSLSKGWQANDLWIAPLAPWLEKGEFRKTVLAEGLDGRFDRIDGNFLDALRSVTYCYQELNNAASNRTSTTQSATHSDKQHNPEQSSQRAERTNK